MKIFLKSDFVALIFLILMFMVFDIRAQSLPSKAVDTEPIELYLKLAESVKQNGKPDTVLLTKYFQNPIVSFFRQRPGFDSTKFVRKLIGVYSENKVNADAVQIDEEYLLMQKYKKNQIAIKKTIKSLKNKDIGALVKKRLSSYYENTVRLDTMNISYVFLFLDEGTGGIPGYVFNSALHTAYLPDDIVEIISAHEAYHTITNKIFTNKFGHVLEDPAINERDKNLLWYLEIVAEEGIADLIDKPVLASRSTPLSSEYQNLQRNEKSRAENKIKLLDTLLSAEDRNSEYFMNVNRLLDNGGHIPGRYMANQIKTTNLKKYIKHTGNPFQFFFHYNDAVKDKPHLPKFSEKSIATLKGLEQRLLKPGIKN